MKRVPAKCVSFLLSALLIATASAAESPIGMLRALGDVTVKAPSTLFKVEDQDYAYFSGDEVQVGPGAKAVVRLSDGLIVTLVESAQGKVSREGAGYRIDLHRGHMVVRAEPGVDFQISHDGQPVSPDEAFKESGKPFVVSVANTGDVRFYMPAQLDEEEDDGKAAFAGSLAAAGLTGAQIAAIIAAIFGVVLLADDNGSTS